MSYAELQVSSNFSFLRGASHPHELAVAANEYGHYAIAITDRNTLSGIVRAYSRVKKLKDCRTRLSLDAGWIFHVGRACSVIQPAVKHTEVSRNSSPWDAAAPKKASASSNSPT